MLPYFVLLSLPAILALNGKRVPSLGSLSLVFIFYVLFIGLRDHVGPDWRGYTYLHILAGWMSLEDIAHETEPLSYLLFHVSENYGGDMLISNIIAAILLSAGVFSFALTTPAPWLAIIAATPYLMIAFGMSGIRQAMGVGLVLLAFSFWRQWGIIRKSILIIIGTLFHTSAIFGGLFLAIGLPMRTATKVILIAPATVLVLYVAQQNTDIPIISEGIETYGERYFGSEQVNSIGSLFHIGLIVVPSFLAYIYRRRIAPFIPFPDLLRYGLFASIAVFFFNFYSTTGASRLTLYLYFVPMMVYPALSMAFGMSERRKITFLIVAFHFVLLFVWLSFGNNASSHIPYRNVLFS